MWHLLAGAAGVGAVQGHESFANAGFPGSGSVKDASTMSYFPAS